LQGQILDHSGGKIMEIARKPGLQLEGLQEEGKAELPSGRFARQESLLLSRLRPVLMEFVLTPDALHRPSLSVGSVV
jgi:hypothetical protein